jgi:hypothetical protein
VPPDAWAVRNLRGGLGRAVHSAKFGECKTACGSVDLRGSGWSPESICFTALKTMEICRPPPSGMGRRPVHTLLDLAVRARLSTEEKEKAKRGHYICRIRYIFTILSFRLSFCVVIIAHDKETKKGEKMSVESPASTCTT